MATSQQQVITVATATATFTLGLLCGYFLRKQWHTIRAALGGAALAAVAAAEGEPEEELEETTTTKTTTKTKSSKTSEADVKKQCSRLIKKRYQDDLIYLKNIETPIEL